MSIDPIEATKAGAEATKAVAETTGKAIDAAQATGGFLARLFGGALEEYGAAWKDRADHYRWKNIIKIMDEAQQIINVRRAEGKETPIHMGTAIPIIEKALLEDDSNLQSMWANLIAETVIDPKISRDTKVFSEILFSMTPIDAIVLKNISDPNHRSKPSIDEEKINISIGNLIRLNLLEKIVVDDRIDRLLMQIQDASSLQEIQDISISSETSNRIGVTRLGRYLLKICTGRNFG